MYGLIGSQVLENCADFRNVKKEYHNILEKILKLSLASPGRYDDTRQFMLWVDQR